MRTVITGGCGFIGRALLRQVLETSGNSDEVILVDNMQRHGEENGDTLISSPQVQVINADLSDRKALSRLSGPVDRLYHLAAVVGVQPVEADPMGVLRGNTLGTMHIMDWFVRNRADTARFLFASSSEVYSGALMTGLALPIPTPEGVPAVISDLGNPRFSYALSKMWGEAYLNYMSSHQGVSAATVRYHNVYGPQMGYDHVIPQVIMRILRREDPFRIFAPNQTRSFCWVGDAAEATYRVMESDAFLPEMVVHIGNEAAEVDIKTLYAHIFDACNWWPEETVHIEAPGGSVSRRCPCTKRLRSLTGYSPDTPLEMGLARTVPWYRENYR